MRTVPIHDLKRNLAALVDAASQGERIVITRHRRPVAQLLPAAPDSVHVGERVGQADLAPLPGLKGRPGLSDALAEDRADDR